VLQQIPTIDITFVGHARGEVRADNGMLGLVIDGTFEDLPSPDVIVFPGGATPTPERVVEHLDRRIITAAGVSAGIDMALRLTELLAYRTAAQAAQLLIEYDPQPPFDCGARPKAGDEVMARVREYDSPRK
jgi:transcriptional regulator GlxA family with amidase domain